MTLVCDEENASSAALAWSRTRVKELLFGDQNPRRVHATDELVR